MGLLDKLLGRGKKAAGDVTGDSSMQAEGAAQERAANAEGLAAYAAASELELHTLQWFLPWFHNPHGGGVRTILRVADQLARDHGVESRFHVYDRTDDGAERRILSGDVSESPKSKVQSPKSKVQSPKLS